MMKVPKRNKNRTTMWPRNSTSGNTFKGEEMSRSKDMHFNVHSKHYSQHLRNGINLSVY